MHRGPLLRVASASTRVVSTVQCRNATTNAAQANPRSAGARTKTKSEAATSKPKIKKLKQPKEINPVMIRTVDRMLSAPQNSAPGDSWIHMPTLRGDEIRLKRKVIKGGLVSAARGQGSGLAGLEEVEEAMNGTASVAKRVEMGSASDVYDAFVNSNTVEEVDDAENIGFIPEAPVGSFVEVRRNEIITLGIVIGSGFISRRWKMMVLTENGESWLVLKEDVYFSLPSLVSFDLATRCGTQYMPENPTQHHARVEVMKRLREVQREVEKSLMSLTRKMTKIYDTLRHKDPDQWSQTTLNEVATLNTKNPTAMDLYATHKILFNNPSRFVPVVAYQANQTFDIRPWSEVENLETIQQWVREKNPALDRFIAKASKIIEAQRSIVEESRFQKPTSTPVQGVTWSETDKVILRFLCSSMRPIRAIQSNPFSIGISSLIKRVTGESSIKYPDDEVHKLLLNVGVFAPWQDLVVLDHRLNLDLEQSPTVLEEREQGILRALKKSKSPNPTHPDDFYATDPLESVRHDWGDMPVYVVDDVKAEELDDGLSIEHIPSEPQNVWMHIHIADPASLIPPTNFLAQKAAEQSETCYLVQGSWPLFPKCITHHPIHGLSLGIRSKRGLPDRVLTFSAKINTVTGDIMDYSVRAGLVRNVKLLDYHSLNKALDMEVHGEYLYPFGNKPEDPTPQDIAPEIIEDFKLIKKVADLQRKVRFAMNWFFLDCLKSEVVQTNDSRMPVEVAARLEKPHYHRGFPDLTYRAQWYAVGSERGSRNIVAEMMKVACRVASIFCTDNNLPVLRRIANPLVPSSEEIFQKILDGRNEWGYLPEQHVLKDIIYSPPAQYSTTPGMHYGLGVRAGEGYVRVTSPLRRYGDLVVHWQIHQFLLGKTSKPRFDLEWMDRFGLKLIEKDLRYKTTSNRHARYWNLLYIRRWMETFGKGKNSEYLPNDFTNDPLEDMWGYTTGVPAHNSIVNDMQVEVQIDNLGLKQMVSGIPEELAEQEVGSRIPLKLKDIRLGVRPLMILEYDTARA